MKTEDIWKIASAAKSSSDFIAGDSPMASAVRAFDWAATSLGPFDRWPASLKATVRMMLKTHQPVSIFWGPELIMLYNDAYAPFLGKRSKSLGLPFEAAWPDVWDDVVPSIVRALSGESVLFEDMRLIMTRNGYEEETFWTFSYSPIYDDEGRVAGLINITNDTTGSVHGRANVEKAISEAERQIEAQAKLEKQLRIIQREMSHRIKNILSMTTAVVSQSLRHATSLDAAQDAINQRIGALAEAQDILTNANFSDADMRSLIAQVLRPHQDHEGRTELDGAEVKVSAQQALGLALAVHELATNAVKYGALSNETGRIFVKWHHDQDGRFELEWRETGGPNVVAPTRTGFGSRLTSRIVASYFDGKGEVFYEPAGVRYRLTGRIDASAGELGRASHA